jgi:sodium transport system ATP-binding protein
MIQVRELRKKFGLPGGATVWAVKGVTFSVAPGEVYGLLGPNGAGKTTTIRMILGLLSPTSGEAWIGGKSSIDSPDEVKRRVGLVAAGTGVYPYLTAREMLLFFADLYGMDVTQAAVELERLGTLLGISGFLNQPCSTLSTGQKQRVMLARAIIHRPPVLLLDEPTLGLDVIGSQIVSEFIEHIKSEGKAVILCTHRLDEAERLCTRFGLMHAGTIFAEGSLADLRERTGCQSLVDMFLKLANLGPMIASDPKVSERGS